MGTGQSQLPAADQEIGAFFIGIRHNSLFMQCMSRNMTNPNIQKPHTTHQDIPILCILQMLAHALHEIG